MLLNSFELFTDPNAIHMTFQIYACQGTPILYVENGLLTQSTIEQFPLLLSIPDLLQA
jgi:hypothetical protein